MNGAQGKTAGARPQRPREYWVAISIVAGIITAVNNDGIVVTYRQRGINQISYEMQMELIRCGFLNRDWKMVPELPKYVSIAYEDEAILGKASATFPINKIIKSTGIRKQ